METKQLKFDQLMEIGTILNELSPSDKETILNYVGKLNNAVRDYENRIKNAIGTLER